MAFIQCIQGVSENRAQTVKSLCCVGLSSSVSFGKVCLYAQKIMAESKPATLVGSNDLECLVFMC